MAPPMWREEETDWEAQEEAFEPSMLSDDLPAVGALLGEQHDDLDDVERRPWHFESDDTLVIPPEPGFGAEPGLGVEPEPDPCASTSPRPRSSRSTSPNTSRCRSPTTNRSSSRRQRAAGVGPHQRRRRGRRRVAPVAAPGARAQDACRPHQPEQRQRPRTGNVNTAGGTAGRDMRVAIGSGVLLGAVALACFAAGTVATHGHRLHRRPAGDRRGLRRVPAGPVPPRHAAGAGGRPVPPDRDLQQGRGGLAARARAARRRLLHLVPGPGRARRRAGVGHLLDRLRLRVGGRVRVLRRAAAQPQPVPRSPRDRLRPGRRHRHGGRRRGLAARSAPPWDAISSPRPSAPTRAGRA